MNKSQQKHKLILRQINRETRENIEKNTEPLAEIKNRQPYDKRKAFDEKKGWKLPGGRSNRSILELMDKEISNLLDAITDTVEVSDAKAGHKLRHDLEEELVGSEYKKRIPSGMKLVINDLEGHLSKIELLELREELGKISDHIEKLNSQKLNSVQEMMEALDKTPETLQGIFGLSDKTIEHFYKCGSRYYDSSHFKEACDVFYLLSILNPQKFNIWLSLGLSEKQMHHLEKALQAFAMATVMNITSVLPHILSAQCYLELKENTLAKETLKYALKTLKQNPCAESEKYENLINHLMD